MFKKNEKFKLTLLVFLPLIIGILIENIMVTGITRGNGLYLSFGGILLSTWTYSAMIFWFYVGRTFGKAKISTVKGFVLGNTMWGVSTSLYLWQFTVLDKASSNMIISAISQYYPLGFVGISAHILGLFTNQLDGTSIILISYFLMLIVFSLGFLSSRKTKLFKTELV